MARERINTKETLKFTREYTHGITGGMAHVDAEVTIDYRKNSFFVEPGSMHIPDGFGRAIHLPKMIATAELLLEITEFVESELQDVDNNALSD